MQVPETLVGTRRRRGIWGLVKGVRHAFFLTSVARCFGFPVVTVLLRFGWPVLGFPNQRRRDSTIGMELLGSLLAQLRAVCATFPDTRKGRGGNIAVADFGLSAFALFFMQSASFLAFQRALEKG